MVGLIYFGSSRLDYFDRALGGYAALLLITCFITSYRLALWSFRPPTRFFFRTLVRLLQTSGLKSLRTILGDAGNNFVAQKMIRQRSWFRWVMHICLSGGCTLAFAVVIPLVMGWVHFETSEGSDQIYHLYVFNLAAGSFGIHSFQAFMFFNALNVSAFVVLIGLAMAVFRRFTDKGEKAVQTFYMDWLPLILIAFVTVTGLMLTVSYRFYEGRGHSLIGTAHFITVVALLLYIPYGKLFHMFQRTVALAVKISRAAGDAEAKACCIRCHQPFANRLQLEGLKSILPELGFNYISHSGVLNYQDICPPCRRKIVPISQGACLGR
ncbi:MAG: major facilitator superfamily 1 [Verrucomicrobiales bacterium]|nr:major facilitator superfamily 1 [Verrucomicrobiales bacterium]